MIDLLIRGGTLVTPEGVRPGSVAVEGGRIAAVLPPGETPEAREVLDAKGLHVLPGAIDVHVHVRSPAYPERATVESETAAAAAGGITTIFEMPITDPCCNAPDRVALRRDHFAEHALVDFALYAAPRELTPEAFAALREAGVVALKIFTTPAPEGREREFEGLSWPDAADQLRVLQLAAAVDLPVTVHAEHQEILVRAASAAAGLDPADATIHGAMRPAVAEALAVEQLLTLNRQAQCRLHIAHVTSAVALEVLRRFAGTSPFSAETCPHYLAWTEADVARVGVCGKINPPIRQAADREALWQALADGTLGHLSSDHAAYAEAEKTGAEGIFPAAPPGHPGLETLLPILLDGVAEGRLSLARAVELVAGAPAERFRLPDKGRLAPGAAADLVLADLAGWTEPAAETMLTAARATARLAHGARFRGRVARTILAGATVWDGSVRGRPGQGRFLTPASGDRR